MNQLTWKCSSCSSGPCFVRRPNVSETRDVSGFGDVVVDEPSLCPLFNDGDNYNDDARAPRFRVVREPGETFYSCWELFGRYDAVENKPFWIWDVMDKACRSYAFSALSRILRSLGAEDRTPWKFEFDEKSKRMRRSDLVDAVASIAFCAGVLYGEERRERGDVAEPQFDDN